MYTSIFLLAGTFLLPAVLAGPRISSPSSNGEGYAICSDVEGNCKSGNTKGDGIFDNVMIFAPGVKSDATTQVPQACQAINPHDSRLGSIIFTGSIYCHIYTDPHCTTKAWGPFGNGNNWMPHGSGDQKTEAVFWNTTAVPSAIQCGLMKPLPM